MDKHLCDCGKEATWLYMPGFKESSPFFCDDCVPRGCDCNHRYVDVNAYAPPLAKPDIPEGKEGVDWKWVDENHYHKVWCYIDERGREYPCCEYDYDKEGFEKDEEDNV
jgi:hypothetical protein